MYIVHCLTCVVQKHLVDFGFIFASQLHLIRFIWLPKINPAKRNHERVLLIEVHVGVIAYSFPYWVHGFLSSKFFSNLIKKKAGENKQ